LATLLENVEAEFSKRGYKIASINPTNSEKVIKSGTQKTS